MPGGPELFCFTSECSDQGSLEGQGGQMKNIPVGFPSGAVLSTPPQPMTPWSLLACAGTRTHVGNQKPNTAGQLCLSVPLHSTENNP